MELMRLTLANFKGIKSFTLEPQGQDVSVMGANATGKTTLQDAFLWLLFDKNSQNKKDFNIKTLDANGEPYHGLEHTVEAVLQVDGKLITLKKTLTEKWTKKRGEFEKQFTGHQTEYWVNDVPVKAREYQQYINGLIGEELFQLITNPMFFPSMHWEKQRAMLLAICGDMSDEMVIASDRDLAKLTDILDGHSVNDYRKIVAERIKKLNEEIAKIPIRIDELNRTLGKDKLQVVFLNGNVGLNEESDYSQIKAKLSDKKAELQEIEQQILSASSVNEAWREKQKRLNQLYADLVNKRSELMRETSAKKQELQFSLSNTETRIQELKNKASSLEQQIELAQEKHRENTIQLNELRSEYATLRAISFVAPSDDDLNCPTCGQALPDDQREAKIEEQRQKFEAEKKRKLEANVTQGKKLKEQNDALLQNIETYETNLSAIYNEISSLEAIVDDLKEQLAELPETISLESHPECELIQQQISALEAEMVRPEDDIPRTTQLLLKRKQAITAEIERLNSILNNREVRAKTQERIKELEAEERKLAQQISELEGHKFLLEKFTKAKVALLEDSINSRFQMVKFKLFDEQINGAVVECCEATINGVPYTDANRAAQINAGLDIINTITRHYGITAPVFIDNAEAVNKLIPCDSQVIRLLVSNDPVLRVEYNNVKEKEGVLFE